MPPFLIDLIKLSPRYASVGLISCITILLVPNDWPFIGTLQTEYGNWFALVGIICLAVCIVAIAIGVWNVIQKNRQLSRQLIAQFKLFYALTDEEIGIIRPFFRDRIRTIELDSASADVQRLVQAKILYRTTITSTRGPHGVVLASFSVVDWAWEIVNENPALREFIVRK